MSWVVWRQYRWQGAIALALLAALTAVELTSGLRMAAAWHAVLRDCPSSPASTSTALGSCSGQSVITPLGNDLRVLSVLVPAVIGVLWGAPLVAHELETGSAVFAWTQGITRSRWLLVKAGWLLLASAACGAVVSALVTFWSAPVNAMQGTQFAGSYFDTQGLVPVGYAVFATALGIAAGALLRRTLPAIAVTLGGFLGVRVLFDTAIRAHLMPAVTTVSSLTAIPQPSGIAWIVSTAVLNPAGQAVTQGDIPATGIPAACAPLMRQGSHWEQGVACLQSAGYRIQTSFQPGWRYWPFQGIETAIYLLLAAALIALAWHLVRRRDA